MSKLILALVFASTILNGKFAFASGPEFEAFLERYLPAQEALGSELDRQLVNPIFSNVESRFMPADLIELIDLAINTGEWTSPETGIRYHWDRTKIYLDIFLPPPEAINIDKLNRLLSTLPRRSSWDGKTLPDFKCSIIVGPLNPTDKY